jgi:hypothetical protein
MRRRPGPDPSSGGRAGAGQSSEPQREVIALRVFLDLDIATTARLLHIAPGTVGAHLSRAVATLRAHVPPDSEQLPRRQPLPPQQSLPSHQPPAGQARTGPIPARQIPADQEVPT